jgi:hypothetical protein
MATLRFWRRKRIIPGLRVNFSKSGVSASVGRRGAWYTFSPRGQRVTVGAPGTGLFLTQQIPARRGGPHVLVRIFAWLVIAILAAVEALVIAAHYH